MKRPLITCLILCILVVMGIFMLRSTPVSAAGGLYDLTAHKSAVQRLADEPVGDCTQCHLQHASKDGQYINGTGEHLLFTANDNGLCFTSSGVGPCHASQTRSYFGMNTYGVSGHGSDSSSFNGKQVKLCLQCHNPHGDGDGNGLFPNLNNLLEENICMECHDGIGPSGAANIGIRTGRPYAHDAGDFSRAHDAWDEWQNADSGLSIFEGTVRHVECADCHNVHYLKPGLHNEGASEIGDVLLGSWGVMPNYSGLGPPSSYSVVRFDSANYLEYHLCLKCHSDWAWDNNPPPFTTDSTQQTNQAEEFNPANAAYHNVTGQLNAPAHDVVYGATTAPAYIGGWGPNSEMTCTDCHSSGGGAAGPHGSNENYMLKKRFKAVAGASDNTGTTGTQSDLCFECHDWNTYSMNGTGTDTNFSRSMGGMGGGNLHTKTEHGEKGCSMCHAAVVHGFQRKHFIVYETDGPPYYKGPTGKGLEAWQHNEQNGYRKSDCTVSCHTGR